MTDTTDSSAETRGKWDDLGRNRVSVGHVEACMTTMTSDLSAVRLMTPGEVATAFRVDPKTVTRWARAGKLTAIRTLGGHRRFQESEVLALLHHIE